MTDQAGRASPQEQLSALCRLAEITLSEATSEEHLARTARMLRHAVGAAGAAIVYARDDQFLTAGDLDPEAVGISPNGLRIVQRNLAREQRPLGFNVKDRRVVDFVALDCDEQIRRHPRDFLALHLPTAESSSELCLLMGVHAEACPVLPFLRGALPALTMQLERVLDAERTIRHKQQLEALTNAAEILTRTENLPVALRDLATSIASATGYDYVTIDLFDPESQRFVLRVLNENRWADTPLARAWIAALNPDEPDELARLVLATKEPFISPDLQDDERLSPEARGFFKRALLVSAAMLPMTFEEELLGTIIFVSYKTRQFTEQELAALQSVAAQMAAALQAMNMHRRLRQRAETDPLTGVLNHAAIVARIREHLATTPEGPHAVGMVDIDGMKAINDTFGHPAGDTALQAVANAMRQDGALVGRYGGDEFIALLPRADRAAAACYEDRLRAALSQAAIAGATRDDLVPLDVSVGFAVYPEEASTPEQLLAYADTNMYAQKRTHAQSRATERPASRPEEERAAQLIGELVPLLTSPGSLQEKLKRVAQRLTAHTPYDVVHIALYGADPQAALISNTFGHVPENLIQAWNSDQFTYGGEHPLPKLVERLQRPLLLHDLTSDQRLSERQRALIAAAGLHTGLVVPMIWQHQLIGTLSVATKEPGGLTAGDAQFLQAVATQVTAIVRTATAYAETVFLLATAAEGHDAATERHLSSVRTLTSALALACDYSPGEAEELGLAAVLHDVGKVRVPGHILSNQGRLNPEEWEELKLHTTWGQQLLADRPGFHLAAVIAGCHHERWDGTGYPAGLSGDAIPEAATIVAVADAFDAITAGRPYRPARHWQEAVAEITACSGTQFNPRVVAALQRLAAHGSLPLPPSATRLAAA